MSDRESTASGIPGKLDPDSNHAQSRAWFVALCLAQTGSVLVFMNFSGALPIIQAHWDLSHTQAGSILAARQIGYVTAVLILSSLTDYVRAERLILGSAIWAALGNLAFASLANNATSGMIFRAITGMGIAGIYMPGLKLISQRISPVRRGSAIGLFVSTFTLGSAASITLGGGLASALGWRTALALTSLGPLLGAILIWRAVRPQATTTPAIEPIASGSEIERTPASSLAEILHNRPALLAIAAYTAHAWETLGYRGWLPAFLAAVFIGTGASLTEATRDGAVVAGIATLLGAVAVASTAALSDHLGRAKTIIIVTSGAAVLILALGFSLSLPWPWIVVLSLMASFLINADSGVISATLTENVPDKILGRTLGVYSFLGFSAGAIAPLVFGTVLDLVASPAAETASPSGAAWAWAFATLALSSLVVLITALILHRELKRP